MSHNFSIILYDTKQDGWNNNFINIYKDNDLIIQNLTLSYNDIIDNINSKRYAFEVTNDFNNIIISYHNDGFYPYENYYEIYKNYNMIYLSDIGETPPASVTINIENNEISKCMIF